MSHIDKNILGFRDAEDLYCDLGMTLYDLIGCYSVLDEITGRIHLEYCRYTPRVL